MTNETRALAMWVVYDSPDDYPGLVIARKWLVAGGEPWPTDEVLKADSVEAVRELLPVQLHRLGRHPGDDARIVEVWL